MKTEQTTNYRWNWANFHDERWTKLNFNNEQRKLELDRKQSVKNAYASRVTVDLARFLENSSKTATELLNTCGGTDVLDLPHGGRQMFPPVDRTCFVRRCDSRNKDTFVLVPDLHPTSPWVPETEKTKGALAAVCTPTIKSASRKHQTPPYRSTVTVMLWRRVTEL